MTRRPRISPFFPSTTLFRFVCRPRARLPPLTGDRDLLDRKISPSRGLPPSRALRQCTAALRALLAVRYAPVGNRGCVRRTSGPNASAEPATPPAEQTGPARKECLTSAFRCRPASGFPPVAPAAVDRFRFAVVPQSLAHTASGTPVVRRRSSRLLPDSLCWP